MADPIERLKAQYPVWKLRNRRRVPVQMPVKNGETVQINGTETVSVAAVSIDGLPDPTVIRMVDPTFQTYIRFKLENPATPPVITSPSTFVTPEEVPYNLTLTANKAVEWLIIGGADAAYYTLQNSQTLRLSPRNFEDAKDVGTDNTYEVQVRATDGDGFTADQTIVGTVTNVSEIALSALGPTTINAAIGVALVVNITGATGGSTITATNLPAGLTLNSVARTITGTPTTIATGSFTLTETLSDAIESPKPTTINYAVVGPTLNTLVVSSTAYQQNTAVTLSITGATAGSTLTAANLPAGLTLNSTARTITGTPTAVGSGSFTLTETLAGAVGSPKPTTVNYTTAAPTITLGTLALSGSSWTVGVAVNVNVTGAATGSALTGTVPAGLTLNSAARTITGTPTTAGSGNIVLTETLAGAVGSPKATTINYAIAAPAPVLGTLALDNATWTVGTPVSANITGATTGSVLTGTIPAGLTLNSAARTITGTPTTAGTGTFTLTETLAGATGSPKQHTLAYTISVPIPVLGTLALDITTVTVGTAATLTITGATANSSLSATGLPAGLTLNSAARTITGTPTTAGNASVVLTETLAGATGSPKDTTIAVTVAAAVPVLGTLTLSVVNFQVGVPINSNIGGATTGSTITGTGVPAGLTLNSNARILTGTPTTSGSTSIVLTETLAGATGSPKPTTIAATVAPATPVLAPLTLSSNNFVVGTAVTINIANATAGSTLTGTVPAGLTLNSAARTITGTPTTAESGNIVLTETLAGATGSPKATTLAYTTVSGSSLGTLSASPTTFVAGSAVTIVLTGATANSSLSATGLPAGLTLNSAARTITGTPTTAGSASVVVTETLAGANGSPKANTLSLVVAQPLTLTGTPAQATVGQSYSFVPTPNGGVGTKTFTLEVYDPLTISGTVPAATVGVAFNFVPTTGGGAGTKTYTLV